MLLRRMKWLGALLALLTVGLGAFYSQYWYSLTHMRQTVVHRLAAHHGTWVSAHQVSPAFIHALIATEDRSFYSNWGISFQGIARAAWADLRAGAFVQGGSTITQELVRDIMLTPNKTIPRKTKGVLLSLMVTQLYTKQQIMSLFINEVYLGNNSWGIHQAAESYFHVSPNHLTLGESAMLAGLPQAPSAYDPRTHWHLARFRQKEVLNAMVHDHMLTASQAQAVYRTPLPISHKGT